MKKVEFEANGLKLHGHLFIADKPKKVAFLFLAGWTGRQNTKVAEMLQANGYSSMTFATAGHEDSDGNLADYTIAEFLDFAVAGYDFFKPQLLPEQPIALVGNSFGGYLAPMLATHREVAAISMRVPANYPDKDINDVKAKHANEDERYVLEQWRRKNLTPANNMALAALSRFAGPIQIIEAENDDSVDSITVHNYVKAVKDPGQLDYLLWKGAPHSIGMDEQLQKNFESFLLAWANKIRVE